MAMAPITCPSKAELDMSMRDSCLTPMGIQGKFSLMGSSAWHSLLPRLMTVLVLMAVSIVGVGQFRGVEWGSSQSDVLLAENIECEGDDPFNAAVWCDEYMLGFYDQLAGDMNCVVRYHFADDKLYQGIYVILARPDHGEQLPEDRNRLKHYFDVIRSLLIEKYGEPFQDERSGSFDSSEWHTGPLGHGGIANTHWCVGDVVAVPNQTTRIGLELEVDSWWRTVGLELSYESGALGDWAREWTDHQRERDKKAAEEAKKAKRLRGL